MGLADLIAGKGGEPEAADEGPELGAAPETKESGDELGVEADESGRPGPVPYSRFAEVNVKRKAEAERAAKAEARAKELEERYGTRTKLLEELYGKFEKPEDQLREDATVAETLWALRDKPEVQAALRLIQQHHQGAVKVSERTEKPADAEPQVDPMVAELVRERTRDTVDSLLKEANVRGELRGVIAEYVLSQKGLKPTREAVTKAVQEYVNGQGWTREFLRGGGANKPRSVALPNPGGLNAGAPRKEPAVTPEKPKTLSQLEQRNRAMFREKMAQRSS